MKHTRVSVKAIYLATALSLAAFVGGYAMAGALTINSSGTEAASGNFETTSAITWWTQASVGLASTPSPLPTSLASTTATSPVSLPATSSGLMINAGTVGNVAHYFKMTESTGAPTSTELEIVFSISTGAGPTITTVTVFIESQATAPSSAQTYTLYYDLGSAASSSIVLNSVEQISQQCTSVGSCP
ncbi:MAG: hypothetical protein L3K17_00750 [Thermoplasmata archaeon]|nr:hypothetical protein [Thermoplasmata archaeon]